MLPIYNPILVILHSSRHVVPRTVLGSPPKRKEIYFLIWRKLRKQNDPRKVKKVTEIVVAKMERARVKVAKENEMGRIRAKIVVRIEVAKIGERREARVAGRIARTSLTETKWYGCERKKRHQLAASWRLCASQLRKGACAAVGYHLKVVGCCFFFCLASVLDIFLCVEVCCFQKSMRDGE